MGSRRAERIIEANQPSLPALTSPVQPIMRDRPTAAGNVRIGDRLERLLGTSKNIPLWWDDRRSSSRRDRSFNPWPLTRVARRFTRPRPPSFQDKQSGACCRRGSSFRFCTARERCRWCARARHPCRSFDHQIYARRGREFEIPSRILGVRRQSFWDRTRLKIRESLAPLVCNIMRLADGAASGDSRWFLFDPFPRSEWSGPARSRCLIFAARAILTHEHPCNKAPDARLRRATASDISASRH
jgi:hypothetical protein